MWRRAGVRTSVGVWALIFSSIFSVGRSAEAKKRGPGISPQEIERNEWLAPWLRDAVAKQTWKDCTIGVGAFDTKKNEFWLTIEDPEEHSFSITMGNSNMRTIPNNVGLGKSRGQMTDKDYPEDGFDVTASTAYQDWINDGEGHTFLQTATERIWITIGPRGRVTRVSGSTLTPVPGRRDVSVSFTCTALQ